MELNPRIFEYLWNWGAVEGRFVQAGMVLCAG